MFGIKALKAKIALLEENHGVLYGRVGGIQNQLNAVDQGCVAVHDRSCDYYKRVEKVEKFNAAVVKEAEVNKEDHDSFTEDLDDYESRLSKLEESFVRAERSWNWMVDRDSETRQIVSAQSAKLGKFKDDKDSIAGWLTNIQKKIDVMDGVSKAEAIRAQTNSRAHTKFTKAINRIDENIKGALKATSPVDLRQSIDILAQRVKAMEDAQESLRLKNDKLKAKQCRKSN